MKWRKQFYLFSLAVIILVFLRSFPKVDISTWSLLLMSKEEAAFLRTWSQVEKAQLDVREVLGPCKHCVDSSVSSLACTRDPGDATDVPRSFISGKDLRPAEDFSRLFIKTRNVNGHAKSCGGDGWRVSFRGPSVMSGSVFDLNNGTYEIVFLPVLPGRYKVDIVLMYSACKGIMDPPVVHPDLGEMEYYVDIPEAKDDSLLHRLQYHMKFRECFDRTIFHYHGCYGCCTDCKFLWNGYGTWGNVRGHLKWRPYIKIDDRPKKVKYRKQAVRKNGTLWFFGNPQSHIYDSVIHRPLCRKIFGNCGNASSFYPEEDLASLKIERVTELVLDSFTSLLRVALQEPKNALILNSAFIGHLPYRSYVRVVDKIAQLLHNATVNTSDHAQIVWSTMTSLPVGEQKSHLRIYNAYTNRKICDAQIPILDLYPLVESYPDQKHLFVTKKSLPHNVLESVERLLEDFFERTAE